MRPIDFIELDSDTHKSVLSKDIAIASEDADWEILSYYEAGGRMALDIQKKKGKTSKRYKLS